MSYSKQEIKQLFDGSYNKTDLEAGFGKLTRSFIQANNSLCKAEGISDHEIDYAYQKNLTKARLASMVSIPFTNKTLFQAFRAYIPVELKLIMDTLIWEERLYNDEIKEKFNIEIVTSRKNTWGKGYVYILLPQFKFFRHRNHSAYRYQTEAKFSLSLNPLLRQVIAEYYELPEGASFKPTELTKTAFIFEKGEQSIFLEILRIMAYAKQGQIKATKKKKPQASTLNKMQRSLNTVEFFPDTNDKNLKTLRTGLIASLVLWATKYTVGTSEIAGFIQSLFEVFYIKKYNSVQGILGYIKGTGYIDDYYKRNVEPSFYNILKQLPLGKWISIDNIELYIKYNFLDVKPFSEYLAKNKLYFNYEAEVKINDYSYVQKKHEVDEDRFHRSIIVPLIKGTFYLFGAFGLVDLAYEQPDTTDIGLTTESPYDGLRYVRLTPLGAFVIGKAKTYELPTAIKQTTIELSKDSLTIIVDENDDTAPVILQPYTERVSPNRFRTEFSFFLKGVKTKKELQDKIKLFKQTIPSDNLPLNWTTFFRELEQKIDPLNTVSNIKVFQIPKDNPELIRLIAKDVSFRKLCMKAEGYHILVEKKKMAAFKKRLQEFGYLLT